jgi:AraC-like DNA-binding protein
MGMTYENRFSDSPYIDTIWRVRADTDYSPVCPADGHWNLLLTKRDSKVRMSVEGPLTSPKRKNHVEGMEWLVIRFKFGVFMPEFPVKNLLDEELILPNAVRRSFWFKNTTWQFPDFENVENFVNRLVHDELLVNDPAVDAALQDQPHELSFRTLRRRFLRATGLTQGHIQQIRRAQQAVALLEQGVPILDTVYQAGYADQPHLTRSLKRFFGETPAQIAYASQT